MIRRACVISAMAAVILAFLATPALAASAADVKLTVVPPPLPVRYPLTVAITGTLTADGVPLAGEDVQVGQTVDGVFTAVASATTDASGSYQAWIKPAANGTWTAFWGDAQGDEVAITVAPHVSLALTHVQSGRRLTEIFRGAVGPRHAGMSVLVQRSVGGVWKTVAAGSLDARSHYRIAWNVPYKTATYKLRTILPEHADHAQGTSATARLRVVIRKS